MKTTKRTTSILLLLLAGTFAPVLLAADHMSEEQAKVWSVVAASWEDDSEETGAWPEEYLHPDAQSWGSDWPAPRDAESIANWSRFGDESGETLVRVDDDWKFFSLTGFDLGEDD